MQKRCKVLKGFMAAFLVVLLMSVFPVVVSAQGNTSNPQGAFYEFGEKDNYAITENKNGNSASSIGSLGLLSVTGDFEDQGNDVYYVQNGNIDISYNVNFDSLETDTKKWHLTEDKTKTVDGIKLDENIQKRAIIVQSSLDGENWLGDNVYTNVFSGKEKLPTTICTTKDIHQLNGCFYRVIVAYKLERQIESSQVLFWEKNNYEYITPTIDIEPKFYRDPELMHWGSGRCVRFDAKGHRVADWEQAVKGFATLDCLLPICCMVAKASMAKPRMPAIQFLFHSGVDVANFLGDLLRHFSLDEHTQNIT